MAEALAVPLDWLAAFDPAPDGPSPEVDPPRTPALRKSDVLGIANTWLDYMQFLLHPWLRHRVVGMEAAPRKGGFVVTLTVPLEEMQKLRDDGLPNHMIVEWPEEDEDAYDGEVLPKEPYTDPPKEPHHDPSKEPRDPRDVGTYPLVGEDDEDEFG